jgi:hypothetical protein
MSTHQTQTVNSSTDWLVDNHKTRESSINKQNNFTQFGEQTFHWRDAQNQKREKILYFIHEAGKFMEANFIESFKAICDDANWHGPQRLRYFTDLLGRDLLDHWEQLMIDGNDSWDPEDQDDDDDFDAALKAFFVKVTGELMPGNLQHQKIMETKYWVWYQIIMLKCTLRKTFSPFWTSGGGRK